MGMTGIVILNVAFVVIVVAGIVGLLSWGIVSSMHRRETEQTPASRMSRAYRMPELTPDVIEREYTIFVPVSHLNDPVLTDRVVDVARGVPVGM
jgi:flagellar basal body-associated protein FliL